MYILFSDIDGTLLNNQKSISPALHQTILTFMEAGNIFVLCSGRPEASLLNLKDELKLPDKNLFIVSCNGAKLLDVEKKKTVYEEGIDIEMARQILDAAYTIPLHCHTYNDHAIICEKDTPELAHYTRHVTIPVYVTENINTHIETSVPKVLAISFDHHELFNDFQKKIDKISNHTLISLCSNPNYFEIFSNKAGKGTAVKKLAKYLSLPMENTIAAGDAANDISMLETAHAGYAMKNANNITKEKANYITSKTNDEDGLVEILEKYI